MYRWYNCSTGDASGMKRGSCLEDLARLCTVWGDLLLEIDWGWFLLGSSAAVGRDSSGVAGWFFGRVLSI